MKKIIVGALCGALILLGGCGAEKEQETVHMVPEFKENPELLKEFLTRCNANPGELSATPNCINVTSAAQQMVLEHRQAQSRKPIQWGEAGSK